MHTHTHSHDHHHHDHHNPDFSSVNLSFVIAVVANLGFTILEAVYALLTDSASLLADAGHNLSDVLGLLLAWGAAYLATKASSAQFSYGYQKTTVLAALVNAVILILAALYIAWESVEKLINPTPVSEKVIMIVAGIGILVNAGSALLFRQGGETDLNLRGAYLHLAYDALISVGVVLAAAAMLFTGWLWLDGAVGLLIVVVIVWGTWGLLRDSVNLIIDGVPAHIDRDAVLSFLTNIDGVSEVHDLHIWALSTYDASLTAHLVMPEYTLWDSGAGYAEIGEQLRTEFKISHVTLQIEKDPNCATQDCD